MTDNEVNINEMSREEKMAHFTLKIYIWLKEEGLPLTVENIRRWFDFRYGKLPSERTIYEIYNRLKERDIIDSEAADNLLRNYYSSFIKDKKRVEELVKQHKLLASLTPEEQDALVAEAMGESYVDVEGLEEEYPGLTPASELFNSVPAEEEVSASLEELEKELRSAEASLKSMEAFREETAKKEAEATDPDIKAMLKMNLDLFDKNIRDLRDKINKLSAQVGRLRSLGSDFRNELIAVLDKYKEQLYGNFRKLEIKLEYPMKPENILLFTAKTSPHLGVIVEGPFPGVEGKIKIAFRNASEAAKYLGGLFNYLYPDEKISWLPNKHWANPVIFNGHFKSIGWVLVETIDDKAKVEEALAKYPVPSTPEITPVPIAYPYLKKRIKRDLLRG